MNGQQFLLNSGVRIKTRKFRGQSKIAGDVGNSRAKFRGQSKIAGDVGNSRAKFRGQSKIAEDVGNSRAGGDFTLTPLTPPIRPESEGITDEQSM